MSTARRSGNRILVCDDEPALREMLQVQLRRLGHSVVLAGNPPEAMAAIESEEPFDAVITDLVMPDGSGMDVLRAVREKHPNTQVLMMTAYATTAEAVMAMRLGAYDYIQKPFKLDEFRITLEKALEKRMLLVENEALRESVRKEFSEYGIVGRSGAMARVRTLVRKMAPSHASVLVTGESGTGKEVVARALHSASPRAGAPFVTLNCGALPEALIESELFGHEKGAFTGASSAKEGLVRAAEGGTLFLDEIGELGAAMQVKLLRVLQERVVRPVGGSREFAVDVRVVAATNRFLEEDVKRGAFRSDLYYRLNVLRIHLPPLRERPEDIEGLVRHFVGQQSALLRRTFEVDAAVFGQLARRPFLGNVRELENLVLRATALASSDLIGLEDFEDPEAAHDASPARADGDFGEDFDLDARLANIERDYLLRALERAGGVRTAAAKLLGMSFRSFRYRIAKYEGGELPDDGPEG